MRKAYSVLIIVLIMAGTNAASVNAQSIASSKPGKSLQHVVLVKFKESSSAEDIAKIEKAFAGLSKSISLIKAFQWGTNNSPENLNQGLTHCFVATFSSDKDRDDYLVHPKHKEFTTLAGPHIDKVTVVDYWVK
ncbi:MAG TPA: Dabb family protein [Flavitalea sp.]|nr:Dabb family protein [Flavitalea sp.]